MDIKTHLPALAAAGSLLLLLYLYSRQSSGGGGYTPSQTTLTPAVPVPADPALAAERTRSRELVGEGLANLESYSLGFTQSMNEVHISANQARNARLQAESESRLALELARVQSAAQTTAAQAAASAQVSQAHAGLFGAIGQDITSIIRAIFGGQSDNTGWTSAGSSLPSTRSVWY